MIGKLRHSWHEFRDGKPGDRFQAQHRSGSSGQSSAAMRVLRILLGVVVTVVGLILMPAPGPGFPVVGLGLVLLAHESMGVARALDAAELRLRPTVLRVARWWKEKRRLIRTRL